MNEPNDVVLKVAPIAGALASLNFIRGTFFEKSLMVISGAALSYYATPFIASHSELTLGLTGFLTGLLGMTIADKVYLVIQTFPLLEIWQRLLKWITL